MRIDRHNGRPSPTIGLAAHKRPLALGRRASFWVAFGVSVHTLWTSAAPALTYRLYAEEWHLTHTATTGIFAIYPILVVATLVILGDVSDHIGCRATMLVGLAASLIGALLFAVAPHVSWLFAARAAMGVGVGLCSGSSSAAILEFSTDGHPERAASATAVAQAIGYAVALLLGGTLIQYAPWPTRLSFWMLAIVIAVLMIPTWFLPRNIEHRASGGWTPRAPVVPKGMRTVFAIASIAIVTAFTGGAVLLSLGGEVAHDLVGSSNTLVNGATLASFAIVSGAGSILVRPLSPRVAMALGALASGASMLLLIAATVRHELIVFLLATTIAGIGYSLLFFGGLTLVNAAAPVTHRGGVLSALYLVGYLSMGSVTLVLGFVATALGLGAAIVIGRGTIAFLSFAMFALAATARGSLQPIHRRRT